MTISSDVSAAAQPRTFVLVHGAWHGGWCWKHVASRLAAGGHRVFTPTLTGLGERRHLMSSSISLDTFAEDILSVIEMEELFDVVLVGHSFAGSPVSVVADRMPRRVLGIVYLDALMIEPGRSAFDAFSPEQVAARREVARKSSGGLSLPPPEPDAFGVADLDQAAWLKRRLTPQPFSTYVTPLTLSGPVGNGLPALYIGCMAPEYVALAPSRARARTLPGIRYVDRPWTHDAMVTHPDALARELVEFSASIS